MSKCLIYFEFNLFLMIDKFHVFQTTDEEVCTLIVINGKTKRRCFVILLIKTFLKSNFFRAVRMSIFIKLLY